MSVTVNSLPSTVPTEPLVQEFPAPTLSGHKRRKRRKHSNLPKHSTLSNDTLNLEPDIYDLNEIRLSDDSPIYQLVSETENNPLELGNPKGNLNFVAGSVGAKPDQLLPVNFLLDSGASHTLVNLDTYFKIPNFSKAKTVKMNARMHTASGIAEVLSKANLLLTFTDIHGKQIQFYHTCLIVSNIKYDCYLGNDILHSAKMHDISLSHLQFKINKPHQALKIASVKISYTNPKHILDMISCNHVELFPYSSTSLPSMIVSLAKIPEGSELIVNQLVDSSNGVIPSLHLTNKQYIYPIIVTNPTGSPLFIPAGTTVASATFTDRISHKHFDPADVRDILKQSLDSDTDDPLRYPDFLLSPSVDNPCNHPNYDTDEKDCDSLTCCMVHHIPPSQQAVREASQILQRDPTISKAEIALALKQFKRTGVAPLSPVYMSTCHEKLTELKPVGRKLLTDQDILNDIEIKHLNLDQQELVLSTIRRNLPIFSRHEWDLGCTDLINADIELKPEAYDKCINSKYIPISPQIRSQVNAIIKEMVNNNILRDCSHEATPIISNLLTTKKRDGSLRILLDQRVMNANCIKLPVVMGSYDELFEKLQGAKFVTKFDISNAFFQISLRRDKQAYTSFFDSNQNRWCFQRCPQGYKNSPYYMEALMRILLHDIPSAFSFCDDIILPTNGSFEEHMVEVNKILEAIAKAKLKLKPSKIEIAKSTVNILGFVWPNGAISIPEARCQAIRDFPRPKTQKHKQVLL
jgi:hypothetical protein